MEDIFFQWERTTAKTVIETFKIRNLIYLKYLKIEKKTHSSARECSLQKINLKNYWDSKAIFTLESNVAILRY